LRRNTILSTDITVMLKPVLNPSFVYKNDLSSKFCAIIVVLSSVETLNTYLIHRLKQVVLHILFWVFVLLFFASIFDIDNSIDSNIIYFSLFLMPVTIATTYVSIYKLIPDYLITKRYVKFGVYSLYTLIISVFGICFSIFYALAYLTNFMFIKMNTIERSALFIITCVYLVVFIVSAFKLLKLNLKQSQKNAELESKILATQLKLKEQELKYLKIQIHPHFLFNTLNTMYGYALKKAEETPGMILKLSNLLDYLLYQVDKPMVPLIDEINHIKDYISLEQMRFNDTLDVNFSEQGCSELIEVAPMLFLPFVENSFKHGKIKDGSLKIDISIAYGDNCIRFNIKNSHSKATSHSAGIGLDNIKKRLELLYNTNYDLTIIENNHVFEVQLKLKLANV